MLKYLIIPAALAFGAFAQDSKPAEPPKDGEKKEEKKDDKKDAKKDAPKETKGSVKIAGKDVYYVAKTGTLPLLKDDGTPRADVFYVYYAATNADGKPLAETDSSRPVMFCFNGGPGSAAVWLHFGGLGPKKIALPPDGKTFTEIGTIADNPDSILDSTDLLFLDPVGTVVELWDLKGCFLTDANYGNLDYSDDSGNMDISMTIRFDNCVLQY